MACLVVWGVGCGSATKKKPANPATTQDLVRAAATNTLECLAGGGGECTTDGSGRIAWHALGDLALVATEPAPILAKALLDRAKLRKRSGIDPSRAARVRAGALAKDLSCRIDAIRRVGPQMLRWRKQLLARAENLGLGSLAIGDEVGALAALANKLLDVYSVRARCKRGAFFLLVSPPGKTIDDDEDPRAHGAGGWAVFTIGINESVLVRGGAALPRRARPIQRDRVGGRPIDPWIPLGEVDL